MPCLVGHPEPLGSVHSRHPQDDTPRLYIALAPLYNSVQLVGWACSVSTERHRRSTREDQARRTTLLLTCVCVGLCLVGCDATGNGNPLDVVQRLGDAVMPPAGTSVAGPTTAAAPTLAPTVDLTGCQPSLAYVNDLTIPDGTSIAAGDLFTKTWSVLNDGTCPWGPGLRLQFVDGTPLGLTDSVALPAAEPGDTVAISVPMRAPSSLGSHRSNWRLSANDSFYGTTLFALVEVTQPMASPTPEASATPSLGPTITAAPTVVPPTS